MRRIENTNEHDHSLTHSQSLEIKRSLFRSLPATGFRLLRSLIWRRTGLHFHRLYPVTGNTLSILEIHLQYIVPNFRGIKFLKKTKAEGKESYLVTACVTCSSFLIINFFFWRNLGFFCFRFFFLKYITTTPVLVALLSYTAKQFGGCPSLDWHVSEMDKSHVTPLISGNYLWTFWCLDGS